MVENHYSKQIRCLLWVTKQFPINKETILILIKTLASSGDMEFLDKLHDYLNNEEIKNVCSEEGFPIKVQIPLMYTIIANISFTSFSFIGSQISNDFDDRIMELFTIPPTFCKVSRKVGMKMMSKKNRKKMLVLANLSA